MPASAGFGGSLKKEVTLYELDCFGFPAGLSALAPPMLLPLSSSRISLALVPDKISNTLHILPLLAFPLFVFYGNPAPMQANARDVLICTLFVLLEHIQDETLSTFSDLLLFFQSVLFYISLPLPALIPVLSPGALLAISENIPDISKPLGFAARAHSAPLPLLMLPIA